MMEAVSSSETSVYFYETARRHHPLTRRREKPKSHLEVQNLLDRRVESSVTGSFTSRFYDVGLQHIRHHRTWDGNTVVPGAWSGNV
jgi:ADP-dependent phosphofructokinase/glucokinase